MSNSKAISQDIADANITTADLKDDSITSAKIATGSVGSIIVADSITGNKISGQAVTEGKLADASVTSPKWKPTATEVNQQFNFYTSSTSFVTAFTTQMVVETSMRLFIFAHVGVFFMGPSYGNDRVFFRLSVPTGSPATGNVVTIIRNAVSGVDFGNEFAMSLMTICTVGIGTHNINIELKEEPGSVSPVQLGLNSIFYTSTGSHLFSLGRAL